MRHDTFRKLQSLGYTGSVDDQAQTAISWLATGELLRIEPYWHFLGADGGFSWSKSWDEFCEPREVECNTWDELLAIALEVSLDEAFPDL